VLELYQTINSVCSQKVRIALEEKGLEAKEHIMTLRGDQNEPAYLKLNPNGVVPTLIHDGRVIVESALILYYLDEVFPDPPLMPSDVWGKFRVRMYNKLIDEYGHNSCTTLTFATAYRPNFLKMSREAWQAEIDKAPLKRRAQAKRDVIEKGLESEYVVEAVGHFEKLIAWMAEDLKRSPYIAGASFSNADVAVIPYFLRLELCNLAGMWRQHPRIADWWSRVRSRPAVKVATVDRMSEQNWAPFKNLSPDPWPKVQSLMKAN